MTTLTHPAVAETVEASPPERMLRLLHGELLTQLIAVSAELGVADILTAGPRSVDELAESTGTDPDALYRVLRALASHGVFTEVGQRAFGLTPLAATLRSGIPGSLRSFARFLGVPERARAVTELSLSVRTGRPAFDQVYGTDWWSHLAAHPDQAAVFDEAMGDRAHHMRTAAVAAYDFSGARRVIDVGGGRGHLMATILRQYPQLRAVVFDRPHVVRGAEKVLARAQVRDRADLVGGDFFESVPADGDVYLLADVLHNWDDVEAQTILATVRAAMTPARTPASKLVVVDVVVPEADIPHPGKVTDIMMLTLLGGRERTEREFAALFAAAGFRLTETLSTSSPAGLLVAVPASPAT